MGVSGINGATPSGAQNVQNSVQKAQDDAFQRKLKAALDSNDEKKLREVSNELESVFVNMMFKEMRNSIQRSQLTESAPGKDIFESMFDEKVAEQASKGKGLGLGEMIYKQLTQEMSNKFKKED